MADVSDQAEQIGRRADDSPWIDRAVRFGMVAYGVVHLLVAWLALQLAFGHQQSKASRNGALQLLAQQPFGTGVVWLVAIGMYVLVLWRLLEAFVGHQETTAASERASAWCPWARRSSTARRLPRLPLRHRGRLERQQPTPPPRS